MPMNLTNTLQVTGCHFGVQHSGWCYPRHHHHLFELLCCLEGEVIQELNRDSVILRPGDWMLIRAGVRHRTMNHSEAQYKYFNVHFDLDVPEIRSMLATAPYRHILYEEAKRTSLRSYVTELKRIMLDHESEAFETADHFRFEDKLLLQSYTLLIIHDVLTLMRDLSLPPVPTSQEGSLSAADVAHTIEERLSQSLNETTSIAGIAKELNLSRSQCTKLFSKVYGLSPRQYVSRQKLNAAKELLVKTNLPIAAVAEKLGFSSASHFSRQFRRWTGQSPTEYKPKQ